MALAREETFTTAPPGPPRSVAMRGIASRSARKQPFTLIANTSSSAAGSSASMRHSGPVMPALLTSAVTGPNSRSTAAKNAAVSAGLALSAFMAKARPPAARMSATTCCAACWLLRYDRATA